VVCTPVCVCACVSCVVQPKVFLLPACLPACLRVCVCVLGVQSPTDRNARAVGGSRLSVCLLMGSLV